MNNQKINALAAEIINALSDGCNTCCLDDKVNNAGVLTQYIEVLTDKQGGRVRLRQENSYDGNGAQKFTLDNTFPIQMGFVNTGAEAMDTKGYGTFSTVNSMGFKFDAILFVHDPSFPVDITKIVNAFGRVKDVRLYSFETNPAYVVLRNAYIPASELRSYDPTLRAWAFTFYVTNFNDPIF